MYKRQGLNVNIFEPDVNIISIQGPKSKILIERMFGKEISELKFFRYGKVTFNGKKMIVARSGWSHQMCFEVYVDGSMNGQDMWDKFFSLGNDLDVRAGCPNLIERIESGLLSYGNDVNQTNTPYEAGLGKFLSSGVSEGCLAYDILRTKTEPQRLIKPIEITGEPIKPITYSLQVSNSNGEVVGQITSAAWSPDFKVNVAIGMIDREYWNEKNSLFLNFTKNDKRQIIINDKFWS